MPKGKPLRALADAAKLAPLLEACEARVVTRQWTSGDLWSPEPYYFERNQYSRGKKLAKQPAATHNASHYGYDPAGRVARIRSWSGFLKKWHEEELFVPEDARTMIAYRFRVDGTLLNVHRYIHDGQGRLIEHEILFAEAKTTAAQTFVWEDGLLTRVDVVRWGQSWTLEWNELGQLLAIFAVSSESGKPSEIYRRPAKGETLGALLDVIEKRLVEVIPKVVAKVKPKAPAYALLLVLDEEEWRYPLPPSLVLAFETDRVRLRKTQPDRMRDFLWSAPEMTAFDIPGLELRDPRLTAAAQRANQHLAAKGNQSKAKALAREVARTLQAVDWSALRAVTDDFVVFVTSLEGDGWRDVRRDAPPALAKRLAARGEL